MKTYQKYRKYFACMLMVFVLIGLSIGCARKKTTMAPPPIPSVQTEPTIIELVDDSKFKDALKEGDIPEEDRTTLSWLPKRPPLGMEFQSSQELQTIYFEFDKYSLTSQAKAILNSNAAWLRNHPDVSVRLEGHCDERGTLEYNQVLGENRAFSTKKYLVMLGIDPDRLYTISYGETIPVDPAHNEESWAKNRRVEFKISQ